MISFAPINSKTVSIQQTLKEFSQAKNISIKDIDFTLEKHETLIKRQGVLQDQEIDDVSKIKHHTLVDKDTEIYQRYFIKIIPAKPHTASYTIVLASNKTKTKVIATIKAGSIFSADKDLKTKLQEHIWHKKLKAGLLIDIFETTMQTQLEKLIKVLPYGRKLSKDLKFNIAIGIDPVEGLDSNIDKIYLEKQKDQQRNYIDGVKSGELVLRYHKHRDGEGGRNCAGEYIPPKEPLILDIPQTDHTIRVEDHEDFIEFYANDNGYVEYENNFLKISKTLKLDGAHFKTTGHLDAKELNRDVSVDIEHVRGTHEDAIGRNLKVDVKELNVDGSIGANVEVSASNLQLNAQTHQKTTLEIENRAEIQLHRGDLTTGEADIDILETGKITAYKTVHIKKMIGGEVLAPKVYIEELCSHGKITASELIEIKEITGDHNTLIIDPDKIESYHQGNEELEQTIKTLSHEYYDQHKELDEQVKFHNSELDRIKTFQQRIVQAQASGKEAKKQDIIRVREYKRKSDEFISKQAELAEKKVKIDTLSQELQKRLEQDLHAQIKTDSSYDGHSKVIFVNPQSKEEISCFPNGKIETISLIVNDEGKRVIKTTP